MRFYDGQPVVCVSAHFGSRWWRWAIERHGITLPTKGTRYTVRGYVQAPGVPCVLLREISNPLVPYSDGVVREVSFHDERFAPITDIGDLTACLDRKKIPASLDAEHNPWDNRKEREKEKND